MDDNKEVI